MNGSSTSPIWKLFAVTAKGCLKLIHGQAVERFERDAGFEEALGLRQRSEILIGRHHVFEAVAFARLALGVGNGFGEEA
jgi:hypothetical protein